MATYLAFKEVWRNKGRFFLFSLVIALITTLVLFIAALAEGLAEANKQFLDKLDAELIVFQENVDLSAATSRIGFSMLNDIARVEGVADLGPVGLSNATILFQDGRPSQDVSLIGVEPGKPGDPPVIQGSGFTLNRGSDVVIDETIASQTGVQVGDSIILKTIQGTREEFFELDVIGMTDSRLYLYLPALFLPYQTWDEIRPQAAPEASLVETTSNIVAVQIEPGADPIVVGERIESQVPDVEVSDRLSAIESLPGFSVQQNTLNTQQGFTLLIGVLVIGGFFQIQMLQKVPLIGVLKAIGASNFTVGASVVAQIVLVTTFGVTLGSLVTWGLSLGIPDVVPVVFNGDSVLIAVITLLAIGPIGGLVSVRLAVRVEPLIALGLSG
jgi:putative ABC transport system permease protein